MVEQKIQKGLIGVGAAGLAIALMLLSSGSTVYQCTSNGQYATFDRLSDTHKTGYWTDENGEHSKVCRSGEWVELKLKDEELQKAINDPTVDMSGWTCKSSFE